MVRAAEGILRSWRHDGQTIDLADAGVGCARVETGFKEANTEKGCRFLLAFFQHIHMSR
jgi:hypothetical protein